MNRPIQTGFLSHMILSSSSDFSFLFKSYILSRLSVEVSREEEKEIKIYYYTFKQTTCAKHPLSSRKTVQCLMISWACEIL